MIEILDKGEFNKIDISDSVTCSGNMKVIITGNNNTLQIGENTKLGNGIIEIRDSNSSIIILDNCSVNGWIRSRSNESHIFIGRKTTMMWVQLTLHEAGKIYIGEDCMFSGDIRLDVSDMHSIIDLDTGSRINPAENITIGSHVWVGQGVSIMKGVSIGDNCVIGAKSLVNNNIPESCVAAGIPAKVIRSGVTWLRERI